MAKQPIFGADDLRHPDHAGPNPFADAGGSGPCEPNPLASTPHVADYEPTSYTAALAPRGWRLMLLASSGTLLAILAAAGSPFFFPLYVASLLTPALTVPAIVMCTQDLRAMQAGAMGSADFKRTIWARRVAVVGLAVAGGACWPMIRDLALSVWSLYS